LPLANSGGSRDLAGFFEPSAHDGVPAEDLCASVLSSTAMRYVLWVFKLALFALALTFAVKNTDPVAVRYFLGHEWRTPLIFVLLLAFCVGAALGVLGALGQILRQRREISSLKRELQAHDASTSAPPVADPKHT
jgi:lipopolysaccharide assembly protein A